MPEGLIYRENYFADPEAWQSDEAGLSILDLVAPEIPPLPHILSAVGQTPEEVTICFPPDHLD